MPADYSFDSESHARTRGDMEDGEAALTKSNDSAHELNSAQTSTRWTSEAGPQGFRASAVAFFESVNDMLGEERRIFESFRTNVDLAVRDAQGAEDDNAAIFEAINRAIQSDPSAPVASPPTQAAPSAQPEDVPAPVGPMPEF